MDDEQDEPQPESSPTRRAEAPFGTLSYELILDALDALGLNGDGSLVALNSYENRGSIRSASTRATGDRQGVPPGTLERRPDPWRNTAFCWSWPSRKSRWCRPCCWTAGHYTTPAVSHSRFSSGAAVGHRIWTAAIPSSGWDVFWAAFTPMGRSLPTAIVRHSMCKVLGTEPRAFLLDSHFIPPRLKNAYATLTSQALMLVQQAFDRVRAEPDPGSWRLSHRAIFCGPNMVRILSISDDSRSAPAMQDLWMMLSGEPP